MPRFAFKMKLFAGKEAEYVKRHNDIWPELVDVLHRTGISNYSIFLDAETNFLFGVFDAIDGDKLSNLPQQPVMQKWWAYMKDLMETNADASPVSVPLQDVFYMK